MDTIIDPKLTYAVVGASADESKYGHKVLKDLLDNGFKAIPVNPKEAEILEQKAYASLADIPHDVDVAVFVVPPPIALNVLKDDVLRKGIQRVWMQPGSESDEAISFCKSNGIRYVAKMCIMIQRDLLQG
ncbi:MAG: CoA-binding protein [Nanoarchaeota archaeon]